MCDLKKIAFSKKEAQTALNRARGSHNQRRKECRMYYCHFCNAWHLTSKEEGEHIVSDAPLKFKKKWAKLLNNAA